MSNHRTPAPSSNKCIKQHCAFDPAKCQRIIFSEGQRLRCVDQPPNGESGNVDTPSRELIKGSQEAGGGCEGGEAGKPRVDGRLVES